MRPREELCDGGRDIGERPGVDHRRLRRPDDSHYRGQRVGLDKFDLQVVVVDLGRGQRGNGMIGQGRLLSGLGPGERYQHPSGPPDSVWDISPHSARKPAAKHAQMHSAKSSLLRDYLD
jgi:hypothetical protein